MLAIAAPRWVVAPSADEAIVSGLAGALHLPSALAALLVQRKLHTPELAGAFLRPALDSLADPYSLRGMDEAVAVIADAVREGHRIMVHGDYDVDGQCATAVLTRALRVAGADVVPFVPHRMRDGYDFGEAGLAAALAAGVKLIITCDCGITAVEAVARARDAGLGVVVTDHHLPGPELPPALAVIDPQQPGDESGLGMLCGTGIAFKLVQALVPVLGLPAQLALHLLDFVALATVADVVPLTGENRTLVRHGLRLFAESRWPGLVALRREAGLADVPLRASHMGFVLGPRLNAAGRVGDAADGLRLLLTDDPAEAAALARKLESLNDTRQSLDRRMLDEALAEVAAIAESEQGLGAAIMLSSEHWHPGVIGIVASRVVERYGRPVFLVAFDGDIGKGSGRSISAFDLHSALVECGDVLLRYGGHQMAAGLTIHRDQLESFRSRFQGVAHERLAPDDLGPEQRIDLVLSLNEATAELERLCRYLEPCGAGNPGPVFGVRGVAFDDLRRVGGNHVKGVLVQGGSRLEVIGFQMADRCPWLRTGAPVDAAFRLERNEWQGRSSLQGRLLALAPTE